MEGNLMSLVDDKKRDPIFAWTGTPKEIVERYEALQKGQLFLVFVVLDQNTTPYAHLERNEEDDCYTGVGKVFWKQEDADRYLSDVAFATGYKVSQLRVWPIRLDGVIELFKKADKRHKSETNRGVRGDLCTVVNGKVQSVEVLWTAEKNAIM